MIRINTSSWATRRAAGKVNLINYLPTKRTRILPTDSGDPNSTSEVEFLQGGNALYVFEHDRIHTWMLC
jgi:hypothetical protein